MKPSIAAPPSSHSPHAATSRCAIRTRTWTWPARSLDCTFDDQRHLTRASIVGDEQEPAHAETGDFYIRGPRVLMDVRTQSAQVPGAGMLRFYTSQDLDGRPVDKPIPVVVTWANRMALDGQSNIGLFSGSVKAHSDNSSLDCRELTLRFQNLPKPAATQPGGVRSVWVARACLTTLHSTATGRASPSAASPASCGSAWPT